MAAWQFDIEFIARKRLVEYLGAIPRHFNYDVIGGYDYAIGIELPQDYESILSPFGDGKPLSWLENTQNWGDYDKGRHITITDPNSDKTSVWSRFHVVQWNREFAAIVLRLARLCDCVLLTKNDTVIEPDMEDLIVEIKSSPSYEIFSKSNVIIF